MAALSPQGAVNSLTDQYLKNIDATLASPPSITAGTAVIGHVLVDAAEAHIGEVGEADILSVDAWTRVADTNAYTIADVISSTVSNTGTTVLRSLGGSAGVPLCRANGRGAILRYLSVKIQKTDFLPTLRVHLYNVAAPTTALVGDNVTFVQSYANAAQRIGHIDLPAHQLYHAGDDYTFATRDDLDFLVKPAAADTKIYYRLEIIGGTSITPSSAMPITVVARAIQL